jgi:hypothetical protein
VPLTDPLPWDEATRLASARGHALGGWTEHAPYRGAQDWRAECSICRGVVWVVATAQGVSIERMPGRCQ